MSLLRCDAGAGRNMQPMRRLVLVVAALAALAPAPAVEAARTGTIEGRVINGTTRDPQGGVEVVLTAGRGDRSSRDTVTTGPDGRYRFEDLPTGEDRFYVLDATYKDGLFAGRPLTLPSDTQQRPVIDTTLRVFEPTTDPNAILIRRNDLYVIHRGDQISVVEAIKVVNPTNNAYIGRGSTLAPGGGDDDITPSLGFALPDTVLWESFRWLEADLDVPQAVEIPGVGFGITTAVPPGEVEFTFTYQVEGQGGFFDISRRALYEISEFSIFAAAPLELESNRLSAAEEVDIDDTTYERFTTSEPLRAADPIQILLIARAGASMALVGGAAAGLVALLVVAVLAYKRTRRRKRPVPQVADRQELITAIAELDLRHSAGEVEESEYSRRRAELKQRLARAHSGPAAVSE